MSQQLKNFVTSDTKRKIDIIFPTLISQGNTAAAEHFRRNGRTDVLVNQQMNAVKPKYI
jgi:hypothetical protein